MTVTVVICILTKVIHLTFVHKVYYQVIRTVAHVSAFMELLAFTFFMVGPSTVHSMELFFFFSVAKISPYIASFEKPIARLFIFAKHLNTSGPYQNARNAV